MAKQVKLKSTPKALDKTEFEVVYENPNALKENVSDPIPPPNPDQYQINVIIRACEKYGTTIQVAEWANKTGFDITLCGQSGSFQHLSITREEMQIVIDATNQLK